MNNKKGELETVATDNDVKSSSEELHQVLDQAWLEVKDYLVSENGKVVDYKDRASLAGEMDLLPESDGLSGDGFLKAVKSYLQHSVRTHHSQFFNQLFGGFNMPAFLGEVLTAATNTSMYTYEVAPAATLIEEAMIREMGRIAGYEKGDGIFLTGGSNGNMVAMLSARNKKFPYARKRGIDSGIRPVAFVSDQAHYSLKTAANVLGLGTESVIGVKSDSNGRLIPDALSKEIQRAKERGQTPFFAVATCGTTLKGAFDPIEEMVSICEQNGLWLHADGSFGGSVVLSDQHRHLVRGLEKTDSFVWNPHKLMNIPLICSALLMKERGQLKNNITDVDTDYIFHHTEESDDLGEKSIQCGRRVDAVKLWLAWKYHGTDGYRKRIDKQLELAAYAEEKVKKTEPLELMTARQSLTICFRYLPQNHQDLNQFNLVLREKLRKSGKAMVNFSHIGNELAIRLAIVNPELEKSDIDHFFDYLNAEGSKLDHAENGLKNG
ncbi:MAG: glutamate decarboxylase [Saprospirales bacterium]|nr:MAG: glutamate decarboxylase [Saprospirales bacterium]